MRKTGRRKVKRHALVEKEAEPVPGLTFDVLDHVSDFLFLDDLVSLKKTCWGTVFSILVSDKSGTRYIIRGIYEIKKLPPKRTILNFLNSTLWWEIIQHLDVGSFKNLSKVCERLKRECDSTPKQYYPKYIEIVACAFNYQYLEKGMGGLVWG